MDELTKSEQAIISGWVEEESFKVYTKMTVVRREAIASQLLTAYNEKQVPKLQGQAEGIKDLHSYIKSVNKKFRKEEQASKEKKLK